MLTCELPLNVAVGQTSQRIYSPFLTAMVNRKGVLDVDTVKGCSIGMRTYHGTGCYGECYAKKIADRNGIDFSVSVSRKFVSRMHIHTIDRIVNDHDATWYRIGTAGDPCHDWHHTLSVINALRRTRKRPVIITKHWITLTDDEIERLRTLGVVINTSTSGLDSDAELIHRVGQIQRLRRAGINCVCRVVTCDYGTSEWARQCKDKQDYLLSLKPIIDNPLRVNATNHRVLNGDIRVTNVTDAIGGGKTVSLHSPTTYLGHCKQCPDNCGAPRLLLGTAVTQGEDRMAQKELWQDNVEFIYVPSVIGSGFEKQVAELAIEDGIAHRAARKNMQIHSAIILLINDEFSGFFTFQNNHDVREFCLLQSVIRPDRYTDDLYRAMALEVLAQNTSNYPALITTDPKSKFETPAFFESIGFTTYLKMSGFSYMINGTPAQARIKILAHITMTNAWNTVSGEWLRLKREWNAKLEAAGEKHSIPNPLFASREGCWQGVNGFANVVTGRSHNGNASVLDPVACEIVLRFFMPSEGRRIYNPFGGGVQFGFVAGDYGYEYVASEIRQNQCDANNKLCSDFRNVRWIQSDSSKYEPEGMFDLIFTCPPYYKVERYVDYDGKSPDGEINSLATYEDFRNALFSGYSIAIQHLNENCFFVVMTGDSRNSKGAYYCSEAETELFLRDSGLSVYNKIVYLESEFTRLAHAKKTLAMRKFPKREQKIIVAYKGDISKIKELYPPIGRL